MSVVRTSDGWGKVMKHWKEAIPRRTENSWRSGARALFDHWWSSWKRSDLRVKRVKRSRKNLQRCVRKSRNTVRSLPRRWTPTIGREATHLSSMSEYKKDRHSLQKKSKNYFPPVTFMFQNGFVSISERSGWRQSKKKRKREKSYMTL